MAKILVTGGAGYIGSTLIPMLLDRGHSVTALDNFYYNQTSLFHVCNDPALEIIEGDCRDEALIKKILPRFDVIIPLAALVGATACDRDKTGARTINYEAIAYLNSIRSKQQMVIYPNTNSGYGVGTDGVFCTEETPLNPISLYGKTKVEAELLLLESGNAITLRLATVFGVSPRMRTDLLVNDFTLRAINDRFIVLYESHFKRNYIHVRDVAKAFIHSMDNFATMKDNAYNVGLSTANLSKLELCSKIKEFLPSFTIIASEIGKDPDQRNYIVSNEKIEKTGYLPDHSLDMGIQELIKANCMIKNNKFTNI